MRCVLAQPTGLLTRRIHSLNVIFVFASVPVFARGGGHSAGHSGGHGGHPGSHTWVAIEDINGGHTGNRHGRITMGTTTRGHFTHQNLITFERTAPNAARSSGTRFQPKRAENRFESRFE
jgi:hypothetical protein